MHIRHCIHYEFQQGKNVAKAYEYYESTYSFLGKEDVVSYNTCEYWFKRFKKNDFNLMDKQRPGDSRKCNHNYLEKLLAENSAQTQKELAEQLEIMQQIISNCYTRLEESKKKKEK